MTQLRESKVGTGGPTRPASGSGSAVRAFTSAEALWDATSQQGTRSLEASVQTASEPTLEPTWNIDSLVYKAEQTGVHS